MVEINGAQFDLFNYQKIEGGVRMTINGSTTAALEEAIGESANISISDEYRGYGMRVSSMFKRYGNPIQHEIEFLNPNIEEAVQRNANNIEQQSEEMELQAGAIEELAELIAIATAPEPEEEDEDV